MNGFCYDSISMTLSLSLFLTVCLFLSGYLNKSALFLIIKRCHVSLPFIRGSSQLFFMFFMSWRLIKINLISQCIVDWVCVSVCVCGNLWVCVVNAYVNRSTCAARRNRFNRVVSAVQNILISISNSVAYYISLSLFNNLVMQRCTLTHRYIQSVLLALAIRVGQRILLYSHSQVVKFFSLYNIYI